MSDNNVQYVNDVLPATAAIQIQGKTIPVDPLKFSTKDEILIRQAFIDELHVFEQEEVTVYEKALESRRLISQVGMQIIPKICPGWTPERVEDELSHESIGAILNFFQQSGWRQVVLEHPTVPTPASSPTTPSAPARSRKK